MLSQKFVIGGCASIDRQLSEYAKFQANLDKCPMKGFDLAGQNVRRGSNQFRVLWAMCLCANRTTCLCLLLPWPYSQPMRPLQPAWHRRLRLLSTTLAYWQTSNVVLPRYIQEAGDTSLVSYLSKVLEIFSKRYQNVSGCIFNHKPIDLISLENDTQGVAQFTATSDDTYSN